MKVEDVYLNNELTVGEDCYYFHDKYTYLGINEEGKYIISKKTKDSEFKNYISTKPEVPQLPLGLYFKHKRNGKIAELTEYIQMLEKMYYKLRIYDDVFKGYDTETLNELKNDWELLSENPFIEEDDLIEQLDTVNSEISKFEKQIEEIKQNFIDPIKEKREEIYNKCKHDWYKYDEDETSKGQYEQECVCNICGKEKINRYSKWF